MKAVITLPARPNSTVEEVITIKGKRLDISYSNVSSITLYEGNQVIAYYPEVKSVVLKGKPEPVPVRQASPVETLKIEVDTTEFRKMLGELSDDLSDIIKRGFIKADAELSHVEQADIELAPIVATDAPESSAGLADRERLYGLITELQTYRGDQILNVDLYNSHGRGILNGLMIAESIMLGNGVPNNLLSEYYQTAPAPAPSLLPSDTPVPAPAPAPAPVDVCAVAPSMDGNEVPYIDESVKDRPLKNPRAQPK